MAQFKFFRKAWMSDALSNSPVKLPHLSPAAQPATASKDEQAVQALTTYRARKK